MRFSLSSIHCERLGIIMEQKRGLAEGGTALSEFDGLPIISGYGTIHLLRPIPLSATEF
jgi:hypothetical protein